jgi:DNA-binding transcriptional MerR regulator
MKSEKDAGKLFYRLDEVGRIAGLDPKVIERWEKDFAFLHAGQAGAGQKIFRQKDLDIILRLKELLVKEGLTLAGAKRKIQAEFEGRPAERLHPDRLKKALVEVRAELQDLAALLEKKSKRL